MVEDGDKRSLPRHRTRLRSGKVLNLANRYLVECQIHDRSPRGARLRLLGDVVVPDALRLYDDAAASVADADVVWRKDREIGLVFADGKRARDISRAQLAGLRGKYYAAGR